MARAFSWRTLAVLAVVSPAAAFGHGIESSITRLQELSDNLVIESRFSSGEPTSAALVRLIGPDGSTVELGRTDAHGQLSFVIPEQGDGTWELQVDGGPGHRDYLEVPIQHGKAKLDQISHHPTRNNPLPWLSALGGTAMLLGLSRIRRPR